MPTAHDIRPTGRRPIEWRDEQVLSIVESTLAPDARLRKPIAERPRRRNILDRLLSL